MQTENVCGADCRSCAYCVKDTERKNDTYGVETAIVDCWWRCTWNDVTKPCDHYCAEI